MIALLLDRCLHPVITYTVGKLSLSSTMLSDPNMVISFSSATNRESKRGDLTQYAQSHWLMPISNNVIRSESSRDALWHFRGSSECRKKCVENGRKSSQRRRKHLLLARRPRGLHTKTADDEMSSHSTLMCQLSFRKQEFSDSGGNQSISPSLSLSLSAVYRNP